MGEVRLPLGERYWSWDVEPACRFSSSAWSCWCLSYVRGSLTRVVAAGLPATSSVLPLPLGSTAIRAEGPLPAPAPCRSLFGVPARRAKGLDSWFWVSECSLHPQRSPSQRMVHSNANKKRNELVGPLRDFLPVHWQNPGLLIRPPPDLFYHLRLVFSVAHGSFTGVSALRVRHSSCQPVSLPSSPRRWQRVQSCFCLMSLIGFVQLVAPWF